MKDLSKYISNKFEKTPSLNNYITEKVLIGKNTKFSKNTATVFLVKTDEDDYGCRPLYDGITDRALMYTKEGMYLDGQTNGKDLFFKSEKYEGWINLYKNKDGISWISPNYFKSKEEAEEEGKEYTCNVTTIKIEWEE